MNRSFGGFKNNNNSSNYARNDRRDDRNDNRNRFNNNSNYNKPMNRSFDRNSSSDYKKPRRDFEDSRNAYQDHRRDNRDHSGNRSGGFGNNNDRFNNNDRRNNDYRRSNDNSRERQQMRHHSPNRSRDAFDSRGSGNFRGSSEQNRRGRMSPPPPPAPSSFRSLRDNHVGGIKSRLNPPLRSSIRAAGGSSTIARSRISRPTGNPRILRRNDLRTGLIAKRSAPTNRAKDYAKKIRQARIKLNERSGSKERHRSSSSSKRKSSREKSTTKKESESREHTRKQENDLEEDYLAIANDVNFDEDEAKSTVEEKEKDKSLKEGEGVEKKMSVEPSTSKEEHHKDPKPSRHRSPSPDIDYICVHCDMHLSTAQDYRNHLNRKTHMLAMRGVALKVRMTLNHLRKVQRDRQLEIEARIKDVEKITSKYCTICKLNFRQNKEEHRESEDHKKIRNFLKPSCKICHLQLASPMKFEMHRCQLDHLRRKQRNNEGTDDEVDLNELDIGDFKTVDSVGDVDDEKVANEDDAADDEAIQDGEAEVEETKKEIGREYVTKVEVNYCSLCREYLSRRSDDEKAIVDHCKLKRHQNWYQQSKKENEKKLKSATKSSESKQAKSPDKHSSAKVNGSDEKDQKSDVKAEKGDGENSNEEKDNSKEEKSKFKRYYENNEENNDE